VIEVLEQLRARPAVKGEMTVLIARTDDVITEGDPAVEVARLQASGISRMDAIKTVAKQFGLGKRDLYRQLEGQSKPK
jgi:16S rRNA (cytidine1402-2'-O)-methyltransferase